MAKCLANVSKWLGLCWGSPALSGSVIARQGPWLPEVTLWGRGEVGVTTGRCWPPTRLPLGPSVLNMEMELVRGANYTLQHGSPISIAEKTLGPWTTCRLGESSTQWPILRKLEGGVGLPPLWLVHLRTPTRRERVAPGMSLVLNLAMFSTWTCVGFFSRLLFFIIFVLYVYAYPEMSILQAGHHCSLNLAVPVACSCRHPENHEVPPK